MCAQIVYPIPLVSGDISSFDLIESLPGYFELYWDNPRDPDCDYCAIYYKYPQDDQWNLLFNGDITSRLSCPFPAANSAPVGTTFLVKGKVCKKEKLPLPDYGTDKIISELFLDKIYSINDNSIIKAHSGLLSSNWADVPNFYPNLLELCWDKITPPPVYSDCLVYWQPPNTANWILLYSGIANNINYNQPSEYPYLVKGKFYNQAGLSFILDPMLFVENICSLTKYAVAMKIEKTMFYKTPVIPQGKNY